MLAEQNHIRVIGSERQGSFCSRKVEGDYEFGENGIRGSFAAHGVTGEFTFETDTAAFTITNKPFWLPETLLKRKITEGLDRFCSELT